MKKRKILIGYFFFSIFYKLLLDFNYVVVISPFNYYDNFLLEQSNRVITWIIFFIFLILGIPFVKKNQNFISILVIFILFFKIIPFTSYAYNAPVSLNLILYEFVYYSLILFFCNYVPIIKLPDPKYSPGIINIITISLVAVILVISGVYAKFRFHLNIMDVYDIREEERGYIMPVIFQYLHNAAAKILPLMLIYYMERKQRIMIYSIILAILLSFGVNGLKSTLLNLFICLFLYAARNSQILKKIPLIFLAIIILATIEFLSFETFWIDQLFVRRLLFMPSLIDSYFFDYINQHSPLFFNAIVDGKDIAFVIGAIWRDEACRANNGLFSDAYGNLGLLGLIVYPLLYAFFFKSVGKIIDKKDFIIRFFSAFIIAYIMLSSFLTVTLFSHGVLLMCIVIMFMPNHRRI